MKTEEDEAFDDIARRQGAWGGGYQAKRQMAMDKLQEPAHCQCEACINGNIHDSDCSVHNDGDALPVGPCDCSRATPPLPAQEPVGFMNAGHVYELQQKRITYGYVYPKKEIGASVAVYTAPPQRPWKKLTEAERASFEAANPKTQEEWDELFDDIAKIPTLTHGLLVKLADVEAVINEALAQPAQEQNFCSRCGKRTPDMTAIHTCTPPQGAA